MEDLELKKKIMAEIMGLMDEKEGEALKNHPKLAVSKVEIEKPEVEKDPTMDSMDDSGVPSLDEVAAKSAEPKEEMEEEIDPEMLAKLMEMYKGMKA